MKQISTPKEDALYSAARRLQEMADRMNELSFVDELVLVAASAIVAELTTLWLDRAKQYSNGNLNAC